MRGSFDSGGSDDLGIPGYVEFTPIGQGGFGSVYRCKQVSFDRLVAVKVLAASGLDDGIERRFERECRAVGSLSGHPHILTVHDSGVSQWGRPYIVMDYMAGGSLADRLPREGPLPWTEAVELGVKVCGAVAAAHSAGINHRDIKPQNVLISSYWEPKLGDFGISTIPSGYQTHSGVITTSLAYAPPEVLNGESATQASDIYSLAATIFSLIKGSAPFVESGTEGPAALITGSLTKPVPDLRAKAPASVCEALERALSKDPAERHASALELGEALRSAQEREGVQVTPIVKVQTPLVAAAAVAAPASRPIDATITSNRRNLFEDKTVAPAEPAPARSRSRLAALVGAGVLVLASSGVALALREQPEPEAPAAAEQTPAAAEQTPVVVIEKSTVKRFTLAHDRKRGVFTGVLASSQAACDSDRRVELRKRGRERPFQVVKTTKAGGWKVRMPKASGAFYAVTARAERKGDLICRGARTKSVFVKPKPEPAPVAPAAPAPAAPEPAPEASAPAPAPAPAPEPEPSDRPDSDGPQAGDGCPAGYHEEEDGRCYPD